MTVRRNLAESAEQDFAKLIGAAPETVIVTRTGSEGFLCTLLALEVGWEDEIVLPISLCQTMANAVLLAGATPVFADCNCDLALDPQALALRLNARTKLVVFHHPHGLACNLGPVRELMRQVSPGAMLLEDCAQTLGASWGDTPCGQTGDVALFSFALGKPLSAGEGGAVVSADREFARRIRASAHVGVPGWQDDEQLGWNSQLSEPSLRRIVELIDRFPTDIQQRVQKAKAALDRLATITPAIHLSKAGEMPFAHVFHRIILDRPLADVETVLAGLGQILPASTLKMVEPAVRVAPPFTSFIKRRYRRLGRDDLYAEGDSSFPEWFRLKDRYLYLRTGPEVSLPDLLAVGNALGKIFATI